MIPGFVSKGARRRQSGWLWLSTLGLVSCISTKFTPTPADRNANDSKYGGRTVYTITCQAERHPETVIKLPNKAERYVFQIHPFCDNQKVDVQELNKTKPLNIVIVLDRTGSMQVSIDAVKTSLVDFSKALESFHWDVHFAAIGFRDFFNDFLIVPFSQAATLRNVVGGWKAEGGGDYQEAGQSAISYGYTMLSEYNQSHPERKDALNVILYVSDGVAFWENDHNNFSVSNLVAKAKEWKKADPHLRFYYSVDQTLDPQRDQGLAAPSPLTQMTSFVSQSGLTAKGLGFPLSREILLEFSKEFVEVTTTNALLCQAQAASLISTSTQGIPSNSHLASIFDQVNQGDALVFESSPDITTTDYKLTIERCCKANDQVAACSHMESIDLPFMFSQK